MSSSQSSCSSLFLCTAILYWNYQHTFFNLTDCSPSLVSFRSDLQLISLNKNYTTFEKNGFICSNCTRKNSSQYYFQSTNQCYKQSTKIKLINSCQYLFKSRLNTPILCQCIPSDQPLQNWIKALVKPGKTFQTINRINRINQSASPSMYILISFIALILVLGGFIGIITFYWIKFRSPQRQTLK